MTEFGLVQGLVLENEPGFEVRPFRFEAVQSPLYSKFNFGDNLMLDHSGSIRFDASLYYSILDTCFLF